MNQGTFSCCFVRAPRKLKRYIVDWIERANINWLSGKWVGFRLNPL